MNVKTVVADSKKRVTLGGAKPGDRFEVRLSDGKFILTRLEPVKRSAPLVRPVRTKEGFLMIPRKLDGKSIAAAVRAGQRVGFLCAHRDLSAANA
jgi:hypothetical protein